MNSQLGITSNQKRIGLGGIAVPDRPDGDETSTRSQTT